MTNKTIFSIDGGQIMKVVGDLFKSINQTRFVLTSKSGKELFNMSLLWVIILGILLPFLTIATIIGCLILSYKVSLFKEHANTISLIDK